MDTINKKYVVTAQVITPLSIGQGSERDWVYGVDFLTDKDDDERQWLYHLSMAKMVETGIDVDKISSLFAKGRPEEIKRLIGNKLHQVSDFRMFLPLNDPAGLAYPIKTFLRNPLTNHPVLAGSSLKGAIRSILFSYLREEERDNTSVFGKMTDGSDFMRFVRVGDFEFEKTCLVNTKIYNLHTENGEWEGGWKHGGNHTTNSFNPIGFNTLYECLPPDATAQGSIMFGDKLFAMIPNQPLRSKKQSIISAPDIAAKVCRIINDHTLKYLDKEITFFDTYQEGERNNDIYNHLADIEEECLRIHENEPLSCILKMSAGAGFHAVTGDWQYDDYTENSGFRLGQGRYHGELPKSRKIAVSGSKAFAPMGFVKLTFRKN
ncbi:MAG: RAMP superfamily CRISPR-associated protein [Paludibacteraceae bacterium]